MARRVPAMRQDLAVATASAVAVTATFMSAILVEGLSDRDWSIRGWEWLDVAVVAVVATFGALWLLVELAPGLRGRSAGTSTEPISRPGVPSAEHAVGTVDHHRRLTPRRLVGAAYRK